jgi:hypothetical protein
VEKIGMSTPKKHQGQSVGEQNHLHAKDMQYDCETSKKQNNLAGCFGQQEYKTMPIHTMKSCLYLMEPHGFGDWLKSISRKPSRLWIGIMPVNLSLPLQKLPLAQIQVKPRNG